MTNTLRQFLLNSRNKSWKPECALIFNKGWRITFTNILPFRFWYL